MGRSKHCVEKEVAMGDKRRSLKEAIAEYVRDDLLVAIEGFTAFICLPPAMRSSASNGAT